MEFDEVAASLAALSNVGIDTNKGVTAMTGLLTSIVAPTNQAQEAMASLGLSTDDLRRVLSEDGLLAAMDLLEERSGGNLDVLKALIPNVRALRGQLGLTGDNAEQVARVFDEVTNSSGCHDASLRDHQGVGRVPDRPGQGKRQAMLIEIGDKLLPILTDLLPLISDIADIIGGVLVEAFQSTADQVRPVLDAFTFLQGRSPQPLGRDPGGWDVPQEVHRCSRPWCEGTAGAPGEPGDHEP